MTYMFNLADATPRNQRVTLQASVASPGKTIVLRGGLAMVVEPNGFIRDLRAGESADSPWCWGSIGDGIIVYESDGGPGITPAIVMFKLVQTA